jgi:hypothetical protein
VIVDPHGSIRGEAPATPLSVALGRRCLRWLPALLAVSLPPALCWAYVVSFGVNVPYYDDWSLVPLLDAARAGTLSLATLASDETGHRLLVPKVVMLGLAALTRWDLRAELFFSFGMLLGVGLVLFLLFMDGCAPSERLARTWQFVPAAALVFSLRQWETLLHGFSMTHILASAFATFAIVLLHRSRGLDARFLGAFGMAVLSACSMLMGLLTLPVGVLYLSLCKRTRELLPWLVGSIAVTALFFWGFHVPTIAPASPSEIAAYFAIMLGAPLATSRAAISGPASPSLGDFLGMGAAGIGTIITGTYAAGYSLRRGAFREGLPWVCVVVYGAGAVLVTAIGRSQLGLNNAEASRYTPHVIPMLVGVYALLLHVARLGAPRARLLALVLAATMLLASVTALMSERRSGPYRRAFFRQWAAAISHYREASDADLENPHYSAQEIREQCRTLERLRLSVFSR